MARIGLGSGDQPPAPEIPLPNQNRVLRERFRSRQLVRPVCFLSPPAPRNVGTPLSAEMPAPVKATTERSERNHSRAFCTALIIV